MVEQSVDEFITRRWRFNLSLKLLHFQQRRLGREDEERGLLSQKLVALWTGCLYKISANFTVLWGYFSIFFFDLPD